MDGRPTIVFIDEIHRFNKSQQDALLPDVEEGTVTLIGATTENPSFEVIGPLLSRARVFTLESLSEIRSYAAAPSWHWSSASVESTGSVRNRSASPAVSSGQKRPQ